MHEPVTLRIDTGYAAAQGLPLASDRASRVLQATRDCDDRHSQIGTRFYAPLQNPEKSLAAYPYRFIDHQLESGKMPIIDFLQVINTNR